MNNNNLNLLYSLTEDLRNQNISLSQYKCLGKNNEETYFLVKIKIEETNLTLNNFLNDCFNRLKQNHKY